MSGDDEGAPSPPLETLVAGLAYLILEGLAMLEDKNHVAALAIDIGQEQDLVTAVSR